MPVSRIELMEILLNTFPDADPEKDIILHDIVGDSNHYSLKIRSRQFLGKNRVQSHKIVYNALKEVLKKDLHAIQINTEVKD
jgi:stress-induced morphogen